MSSNSEKLERFLDTLLHQNSQYIQMIPGRMNSYEICSLSGNTTIVHVIVSINPQARNFLTGEVATGLDNTKLLITKAVESYKKRRGFQTQLPDDHMWQTLSRLSDIVEQLAARDQQRTRDQPCHL